LKTPLQELSVALVGDRAMSRIHEQFLGLKGPTDVMSFPLEMDRRGRVVSGEVVVCVAEARRQARRRGIPVWREVLLYALHGLLHLSGFDDRTEADYRNMHLMEDRILMELDIGATFEPVASCRLPVASRSSIHTWQLTTGNCTGGQP
jgi:probable rRNA maturation factor